MGAGPEPIREKGVSTSIQLSLLPDCRLKVSCCLNSCCHAFPAVMDCIPSNLERDCGGFSKNGSHRPKGVALLGDMALLEEACH